MVMSASKLTAAAMQNDEAALAHLETVLWPNGAVCPFCGAADRIYTLKGKSTRPGVRKCGHCRKPFTVTVGTVMERSKVPLHKWVQAITLLTCSKKGIPSHQLHRVLGVSYPTAWFMAHRIREAMRDGTLAPLGGNGKIVEADETYHGQKDDPAQRRRKGQRGPAGKRAVVALVERGGKVRSFHVASAGKATVAGIVRENVARESRLMTDESAVYTEVGAEYARHETVKHIDDEYVRGDAYTNTIEGYFSIFKRGMKGVYQHCSEKHLHRYLAEFDFRYNNRAKLGIDDGERALRALAGAKGKRLTYRRPHH
jgi:transposase-like protein